METAHTIGNRQLVNGKWQELQPVQVPVGDGLGVSWYERLIAVNPDVLLNFANGDVLNRTKKDKAAGEYKHYFSPTTGVFVNVWLVTGGEDGE